MNMAYHKGYPCVYKAVLCQEGYCSNCGIYFEKSRGWVNQEASVNKLMSIKRPKSISYSLELTMTQ